MQNIPESTHAVAAVGRSYVAATAVLQDVVQPLPLLAAEEILVKVNAAAVNPVDGKQLAAVIGHSETHKVLGFDAHATVIAVGESVREFAVGDLVFYAGNVSKPGSFADFQIVEAALVAHSPKTLSAEQAAALPLTGLTAWESLFERLPFVAQANANQGKSILLIGAAGGVGSMAIQLAKWAGLQVVASAARDVSKAWCRQLGADQVVEHQQLAELAAGQFDAIACFYQPDNYWTVMADLVKPQGHLLLIVDNQHPLPLEKLKSKSVAVHWEFMFTRALYQTADRAQQGWILAQIAKLIDEGSLHTTLQQTLQGIDAVNVQKALVQLQQGHQLGKLVLVAKP